MSNILRTLHLIFSEHSTTFGGWETSLYKRGFNDLLDHFITCVEDGKTPEPSIEDSLITHEICEKIVRLIV